MRAKKQPTDLLFVLITLVFIVVAYVVFDKFLSLDHMSELGVNIVASVLCSLVTVVLMMLMMRYQMQSEETKQFRAHLFERKLELYREFLQLVFAMDDDNLIDREEVQAVENKIGELALVSGVELVSVCAQFVLQLKSYGVLYTRSFTPKQLEHYEKNVGAVSSFVSLDDLVQAIRNELSVVDGDISNILEKFVNVQYDHFHMIKNPNNVD